MGKWEQREEKIIREEVQETTDRKRDIKWMRKNQQKSMCGLKVQCKDAMPYQSHQRLNNACSDQLQTLSIKVYSCNCIYAISEHH